MKIIKDSRRNWGCIIDFATGKGRFEKVQRAKENSILMNASIIFLCINLFIYLIVSVFLTRNIDLSEIGYDLGYYLLYFGILIQITCLSFFQGIIITRKSEKMARIYPKLNALFWAWTTKHILIKEVRDNKKIYVPFRNVMLKFIGTGEIGRNLREIKIYRQKMIFLYARLGDFLIRDELRGEEDGFWIAEFSFSKKCRNGMLEVIYI